MATDKTEVARRRVAAAQHATGERAGELGARAHAKYLERPELFVGGAVVGGLLLARVLKALGSDE